MRNRSPYGGDRRSRSPRNIERGNSYRKHPYGAPHPRNPNIRNQRFCYGCGSPDHILRDRKYAPTLSSIKTNLVNLLECENTRPELLAEELLTLQIYPTLCDDHSMNAAKTSGVHDALERHNGNALEREADRGSSPSSAKRHSHVHFGESLYDVEESETY